jgi:hypothetical protein
VIADNPAGAAVGIVDLHLLQNGFKTVSCEGMIEMQANVVSQMQAIAALNVLSG